ncbi:MAG: hypothetical protein H7210_04200 [Pyrinomonadaceae bacterium]|nr:hypothetical protein [Phycisphaerales bacterium]
MQMRRAFVGDGFTTGWVAGCLVVCVALWITPTSTAYLLPLVNPGFEQVNVTLRPGEQTNGAGGGPPGVPETPVNTRWRPPFQQGGNMPQSGVLIPGWRTMPGGRGSLAGVLNPAVDFGGRPWMAGYSGNYVAVAQAAFMQQTLDVQIASSTTYTLRFLAGIGLSDSEYSPLIQLLAAPDLMTFVTPGTPGVEFLARLPLVKIRREQFGTMLPFSFSVTTPEVLPQNLVGKYIAISFLGSDGIPRMTYDDFRLEAVPAPSGGVGAGVLLWMCMRRRR